jgi:hypothetical protein
MKDKKLVIYLAASVVFLFLVGIGAYYYYATLPKKQTPTTTTETTTTDNEILKDEVIHNTPEPEGIATPQYEAAPTPPAPPTS